MKVLEQRFLGSIEEIYDAEVEIIKALSKIIPKCISTHLKETLDNHSLDTQHQIARLDDIENILGVTFKEKEFKDIRGILEDGDKAIDSADIRSIETVIIYSCRNVEHFEISTYKIAISHAKALKYKDIEKLLQQTLKEEIAVYRKLTKIGRESNLYNQ